MTEELKKTKFVKIEHLCSEIKMLVDSVYNYEWEEVSFPLPDVEVPNLYNVLDEIKDTSEKAQRVASALIEDIESEE